MMSNLKTILILIALIFLFALEAYSQQQPTNDFRPKVIFNAEKFRDPFESYVSEKTTLQDESKQPVQEEVVEEPKLDVSGIIWGGKTPCAIINNKVLKEGDTLDDVKINKITKEGVKVLYKRREFLLSTPAKSGSSE